jgi:hypothetical protein
MPNSPTSRETDGKGADEDLPIGLVLAAVIATFILFGPALFKSDQKGVDVAATQLSTESPIKTP